MICVCLCTSIAFILVAGLMDGLIWQILCDLWALCFSVVASINSSSNSNSIIIIIIIIIIIRFTREIAMRDVA